METRSIKDETIARLKVIEKGLERNTEEWYQMVDLIDSLSGSLVEVTQSRPSSMQMPGACGVNVD